MSGGIHYLMALLLSAVLAWQLFSGKAMGGWWFKNLIIRQQNPVAYWIVVASQGAIIVAFVLTGRTWHVR